MAKKTDAKEYAVAALHGLNFREAPKGAIKAVLPDGEVVRVVEYGAVWSKIKARRITGWVMTEYLKEVAKDA